MIAAKSLRLKITLIIILVTVFWLLAGLSFSNKINKLIYNHQMESTIYEDIHLFDKIHNQNLQLIHQASPGLTKDINFNNSEIEQFSLMLISNLQLIAETPIINNNLALKRRIRLITENCTEISRISNEYIVLLKEKGNQNTGLISQINENISQTEKNEFSEYLLSYNPDILNNILLKRKNPESTIVNEIFENANSLNIFHTLQNLSNLDYKLGYYYRNGLTGDLELFSNQNTNELRKLLTEFHQLSYNNSKNYLRSLFIFIFIIGLICLASLYFFFTKTIENIHLLKNSLCQIEQGKFPEKHKLKSDQEFNELFELINRIIENLNLKKKFAQSITEGNKLSLMHEFKKEDELGKELNNMAKKLEIARKEDDIHKLEERKRSWHSEGLAQFGEIFRSERDDVIELAYKVIKKLVKYLHANQGVLFILNDENEKEPFLESVAAFAYDRRKYPKNKVSFGEGLIGTCALEKETIYMNEIPDDYIKISSGLGEAPPRSILIVPLKLENEIFGILEIASFSNMKTHEINFTEQLAESIATTLAAVRINEKTSLLLEQSQVQAKDMLEQEEKMKRNVHALERAQDESKHKETEITGILNAVNASSLVNEFSLNGRFAEINDKFLALLEISRDQLIGKHHSEFSVKDKYSNEYKKFWRDLRAGKIISLTEKYKLFSGKEIWLKETFTPIQDKEGNTIKILNIAHDLSQNKLQQQVLEEQSAEITRRNIEMISLSEAVDKSILKCEYSPDGIITNANSNFCNDMGFSIKELLGKNARLFLKEDEKKQFETIFSEVLKNKAYSGVVKRSKPTGEEIWLMSTYTPVKEEDGSVYKIYFLAQNITEKKLKYQLLEEANKEIERLNILLDQSQNQ